MTAESTSRTCAACGSPGTGSYCSACGASLGPRTCRACQAELSPRARFCHRCGTPAAGTPAAGTAAAPGARSERTAWLVAGAVSALLIAVIVYRTIAGTPVPPVPDMANAGNAAPGRTVGGDPGGALPTGRAPDISSLSPAERFLRLNNRIMEAASRGDSATVVNFTPMALGAYAQLDSVTNDERYHAAVLNTQVGRTAEALALTDTMLQVTPGYLLAWVVRADIARFQNDRARLGAAYTGFTAAWDRETAARRAEYADHQNVLDEFRTRADSGRGR